MSPRIKDEANPNVPNRQPVITIQNFAAEANIPQNAGNNLLLPPTQNTQPTAQWHQPQGTQPTAQWHQPQGAPEPMIIDFPAVPPLAIAGAAPIQNANVNITMTVNRSMQYVSGRVQESIDASYKLNRTYP